MVKNGRDQSGYWTLKLTVSQEWTILHAGANSGKLQVISMIFGCARHLVHQTLKSAYLKNEFMNSADFLHADCEAVMFG